MPNIADFTNSIGNARVFSKLVLLKGYFQVPLHPADMPRTATITPFVSYVFHYSTFVLRNSGATLQRMMDSIFGDLPNVIVYIDDLFIFSENNQELEHHLRETLTRLQRNGLIIRQDKCVFGPVLVIHASAVRYSDTPKQSYSPYKGYAKKKKQNIILGECYFTFR